MPDKIVRLPSSNPAYPAIKVPEAINQGELLAMPDKIVLPSSSTRRYWFLKKSTLRELLAIANKIVRAPSSNPVYPAMKVPEVINPGRANSYAKRNRTPT